MSRGLRIARLFSVMARQPPKKPLIAIIGATGTGKSQLAVSLAKRYNGEIINGDAMQLYAGLAVITNKITDEEQQGIPHHLLGCIGYDEQTWVVGIFVKKALKIIEEIRSRGRLPILVGGTHYYTQSLLFLDRLANDDGSQEQEEAFVEGTGAQWPILQQPTEVLLNELKKVDPVMAERWHPNDRRKIQRSLEIHLQTGQRASDIYAAQKARQSAPKDGALPSTPAGESTLRFPTLLFWVHANGDALQARLDKRVDMMLHSGLLDEVDALESFAEENSQAGNSIDETRGIWVSIGYKEFKEYIRAKRSDSIDTKAILGLKGDAIERTKISTRQYAKRQVRWIRIKLMNALYGAGAQQNLFLLDGSEASSFEANAVSPAVQLMQTFLQGDPLPQPASLSPLAAELLSPKRAYDMSATPEKWIKQYCEACDVTCVMPEQWQMHVKSKAHRKLTSKKALPAQYVKEVLQDVSHEIVERQI